MAWHANIRLDLIHNEQVRGDITTKRGNSNSNREKRQRVDGNASNLFWYDFGRVGGCRLRDAALRARMRLRRRADCELARRRFGSLAKECAFYPPCLGERHPELSISGDAEHTCRLIALGSRIRAQDVRW